ncbi:conserved hypothetical protein [Xenorhabdus nematophila F1]|nr:conserved hypothetical protein [Xenorhabdus nematophila F1]CEE91064.1 hypothetical protein XNA1_1950029 [Xenorhabdus nematophila str. Anatoliense]CEE95869.1 hypothetical protein XNA1_720030 [Xenorhabdus nematophila str. Anatoliense]CEK22789.1 hypothetical protein XNC2_1795 [Xenorhabdus nematophila AN6/1]
MLWVIYLKVSRDKHKSALKLKKQNPPTGKEEYIFSFYSPYVTYSTTEPNNPISTQLKANNTEQLITH